MLFSWEYFSSPPVMAPHGKELSLDFKKSIISLHTKKQGYQKIATTLNLSKNTMAKVVQHYQKYGTIKSVNRRSGRPHKLKISLDRYITKGVSQNPRKSAAELVCEVSENVWCQHFSFNYTTNLA